MVFSTRDFVNLDGTFVPYILSHVITRRREGGVQQKKLPIHQNRTCRLQTISFLMT